MNLSRKFLAGAIISLLPLGSALACNTSAWLGTNTTAVAADSGEPAAAFKRYAGRCALRAAPTVVVADNSPAGASETTYAARFYVHTGLTAGSAKVFSATTGDNGSGTETIGITYNQAGNFDFAINGASVGQVTGITASRWYSIDLLYQSGASFNVDVAGAAGATPAGFTGNLTVPGIAAGSVGSVTLGFLSGGGTGTLFIDEFDSSRAATKIGRLARGNARAESPVVYNVFDIIDTAQEVQRGAATFTATGQPDATEDGLLNVFDIIAVARRVQTGSF